MKHFLGFKLKEDYSIMLAVALAWDVFRNFGILDKIKILEVLNKLMREISPYARRAGRWDIPRYKIKNKNI